MTDAELFVSILLGVTCTVATALATVMLVSLIMKAAVLEEVTLRDLLRMAACALWITAIIFITATPT